MVAKSDYSFNYLKKLIFSDISNWYWIFIFIYCCTFFI